MKKLNFYFVSILIISFPLYAEDYQGITMYYWGGKNTEFFYTKDEACTNIGFVGSYPLPFEPDYSAGYFQCATHWDDGSIRAVEQISLTVRCPGGGSYVPQTGMCTGVPDCEVGYSRSTSTGLCAISCPDGKIPAYDNPNLNSSSDTCVYPDDVSCSAVGVDINAFVPKCSQMIPNSPDYCLTNDLTPFSLDGCPLLECADGSQVFYPAVCPDLPCPDPGATRVGGVCVSNLNVNDEPCLFIGNQPICADDPKPCVFYNGEYVCVVSDEYAGEKECQILDNVNVCISNEPQITVTESAVVTNPDGSTTKTVTTESNILGDQPEIKVITTNTDGSVSTTIKNDTNQRDKLNLDAIEKNTRETSDNTKSIDQKLSELLDPDTSGYEGTANSFENSLSSTLNQLANEEASLISDTPNPFSGLENTSVSDWLMDGVIPTTSGCSGGIHTSIFNRSFDLEPCAKLAPLREVLAWVFSFIVGFRIFNMIFTTNDP